MSRFAVTCASLVLLAVASVDTARAEDWRGFKENPDWRVAGAVSAVGDHLQTEPATGEGDVTLVTDGGGQALEHNSWLGDVVINLDFLVPGETEAYLLVQKRYDVRLPEGNNEWQHMQVKYRTTRYDAAGNRVDPALVVEVRVNGDVVERNTVHEEFGPHALTDWTNPDDGQAVLSVSGPLAIRDFDVRRADFSAIELPEASGGETNEDELVDDVARGRELFSAVGCNVCHGVERDSTKVTTGPSLFGLFHREPRDREIVAGGEGHRFRIKADRDYLHNSVRSPNAQLAVVESGAQAGEAWSANMPPISRQVLTDQDVDAIGAYLATLNRADQQGPVVRLVSTEGQAAYDPLTDDLQLLVDRRTRIQRGPLPGTSGRAIHVGQPNNVNYSFDPRLLGITRLWQGGFLDMGGEFRNRGGGGLKLGYKSIAIDLGEDRPLLAPLNADGAPVDFTFQGAVFGDVERVMAELNSEEDHVDKLAKVNAQFLGYTLDSSADDAAPAFSYRVGDNKLTVQTRIGDDGQVTISLDGRLEQPQSFALNTAVLSGVEVSTGELDGDRWVLPAGDVSGKLDARIALAPDAWHPPASEFEFQGQPLVTKTGEAKLPAGYRIENYYAPRDHYGREQLFEALGLALAPDGTLVVATRTAGIWHLKDGRWYRFAEGTFDSLGVQVEDEHGRQLVVGQKAELTRIIDTNDDGLADRYQTLFDAFSYHGNYHSYMHGPVRGEDGAYYLSINLADGGQGGAYNAGGPYMGSAGGFAGWHFRVTPEGEHQAWANGLRSPAGLGVSPEGRIFYSDNQGEYMGTSKIFTIEEGAFYGHPSSLVDLPGMTPESPEIQWENVLEGRAAAAILLPHNRLANSPGNPAWDTTGGRFGPFSGQMLMGDQTQSNLFRVAVETVNGQLQGSVMPFIDGLESGVMRPLFLEDGSLLLGQTGRGWQAKGGHVASLQRITWDGETVEPAIINVAARPGGFAVNLTRPLADGVDAGQLEAALKLESWVYRDSPSYGSDELGHADESLKAVTIAPDRRSFTVDLAVLEHPPAHPQQTARVYHLVLQSADLFDVPAPAEMTAYYTLYSFPAPGLR